ncbi:nucleoside phosphorylase domain-containing protein [Dactylonectria estremocensis]|uniref:Nucleoside phosphorylase domain-containing protein n=1 Tax=Dactylonectria estremocensis TaxID=1079267 RepID=A0A9P9JEM3_9HYPO|nr:nucleoside phosphorylase domain-containing protein [Dactylonectria estremocensis]
MDNRQRPSSRADFNIAIICSLPLEFDALSLIIDEQWDQIGDRYGRAPGDVNNYTTARIGKCNVVIMLPSRIGKANSANATASLRSSYPNVKLALLVGICGGVPSVGGEQMRFGDVVLSRTVVEYGFGRQSPRGFITQKDTVEDRLSPANRDILNLLAPFKSSSELNRLKTRTATVLGQLQNAAAERGQGAKYNKPDVKVADALDSAYRPNASRTRVDKKPKYQQDNALQVSTFAMYVGPIASADMVVESEEHLSRLIQEEGVIAFEIPGAGVWKDLPTITVKGVCDYPNFEKSNGWQEFAAATAASTSKAILEGYVQTENSRTGIALSEIPTATQRGSTYGSNIKAKNVDQGEKLMVSSTQHRHYVQEKSQFGGDVQGDEDVAQGNRMTFS